MMFNLMLDTVFVKFSSYTTLFKKKTNSLSLFWGKRHVKHLLQFKKAVT